MPLRHFHSTVRQWFQTKLGEPSEPQARGWPLIRARKNVLIAAPTGSGKTLAAFLSALDELLRQGQDLRDETQVLYVSPLRALSNDIQKNLQGPLSEIAAEDIFLPEVRVLVRTGDTAAKDRQAMTKKPPHILVTTPESLYILLTSQGGRRMLSSVKTVIVDEIHALARDKRGSHLALSLERLDALCGPVQRIGLSATQKPLEEIARFLAGRERPCEIVDAGHLRTLDLAVEVPPSPLGAVCSHEVWEEMYARMAELIQEHRTTLIFSNTRKLAERMAARLTGVLGPDLVTCHHGSLSKEMRLDAEQRLKAGKLRALVATASLELGIDIGDVDLVLQIGSPRSIATFLQRVGRAGHGKNRVPKGRYFPLTLDELAEAGSLLRAVRAKDLDRILQPQKPLDILAQQVVAACVAETWHEDALFESFRRAWPYRELSREEFDACVNLHTQGRYALLHRDGVNRRLMATKRARITAVTGGGAIPDTALYQVLQEPEGTFVGTLDEDFSIESNVGDIFQLGNTSWQILKVESREGVVRVVDAKGQPPTIPFWFGEAPSRTAELSSAVGQLREDYVAARARDFARACAASDAAASPLPNPPPQGGRGPEPLAQGDKLTKSEALLGRVSAASDAAASLPIPPPQGGRGPGPLAQGDAHDLHAPIEVDARPNDLLARADAPSPSPSPLVGEGRDGGSGNPAHAPAQAFRSHVKDHRPNDLLARADAPSPSPSPLVGEGRDGGSDNPAHALAEGASSGSTAALARVIAGAAWIANETGLGQAGAMQVAEYFEAGLSVLGALPTQKKVVIERFFDESGGMQLVLHAPFGGRVNRAWGLALRKRFCRGFGFELQAAADEDALVISLGPQHSFPLDSVYDFLHPNSARKLLIQAVLDQPMFGTRWRWNSTRSLMVERTRNGKRTPAPLVRMRAADLMVAAFPHAQACPETLPPGDIEVPLDHPLVRQTVDDCLFEAMDADGFLELIAALRDGRIERHAVDTVEPSPFARGILAAKPYAFLDDAPLEERRTWAVSTRRALDIKDGEELGALDPAAIACVREEAWPHPESAEELHEALMWMGYVTADEARASGWQAWIEELARAKRVAFEKLPEVLVATDASAYPEPPEVSAEAFAEYEKDWTRGPNRLPLAQRLAAVDAWFAAETPREPKALMRGRLEALGPVYYPKNHPLLLELETEGGVLRGRFEGREGWCDRRLLARIHRYTLDRLRKEIEPVSAAEFLRFLACWQRVDDAYKLDGPSGVADIVRQLAGFEIPAAAWEAHVFPARVKHYRREWLDQVTLSGEVAWGRLWTKGAAGSTPIRTTPIALVMREDLELWSALARANFDRATRNAEEPALPDFDLAALSGNARTLHKLLNAKGAMFPQELARQAQLLPEHFELGLGELITQGLLTCDSFGGLRQLIVPASKRRYAVQTVGRWSLLAAGGSATTEALAEFAARQLLRRTGVVFRKTIAREKLPVPWRDLLRALRRMELRGEVRGGRFVARFDGEQYALPEAVTMLRDVRRKPPQEGVNVSAADPLNFAGILTPDARVSPMTRGKVRVS
ncbi:MAG: DEAD/DEAH box helicase [Planctomycetota bacterium]|nr:DEAD/DEAH box helicase [Planctomycetota bacterium]